ARATPVIVIGLRVPVPEIKQRRSPHRRDATASEIPLLLAATSLMRMAVVATARDELQHRLADALAARPLGMLACDHVEGLWLARGTEQLLSLAEGHDLVLTAVHQQQ